MIYRTRLQGLIHFLVDNLALLSIPLFLLAALALSTFSQSEQTGAHSSASIALQVWEQPQSSDAEAPQADPATARAQLQDQPSELVHQTRLSRNVFWFMTEPVQAPENGIWLLDLPSRHASHLICWDASSLTLLGEADRTNTSGLLSASRAGFALELSPGRAATRLLCRASYRGPAKISADLWSDRALASATASFERTGAMVEAGIGVLAIFMLLTALVNQSNLYYILGGWLALNMRMAGISAGTDFSLFSHPIPAEYLTTMRQWTVAWYYVMTVALFSLLFKKDLTAGENRFAISNLKLSAVLLVLICPFISFEQTLQYLWVATAASVGVALVLVVRILRRSPSRTAIWYGASIAVTLLASLNEVIAAYTGSRNIFSSLNSVSGAIFSALLACAAVAEHIRSDRLLKLQAEKVLKTAYEESPIGLFTVSQDGRITKYNPAFAAMLAGRVDSAHTQLQQVFTPEVADRFAGLHLPEASATLELEVNQRVENDNRMRWFAIKASVGESSGDEGSNVEASLQDITERVRAVQRLEFLASHDPLTECLNLRGMDNALSEDKASLTALAYFDLDRFKLINDLYGHNAGDRVLREVCARMKAELGGRDLLARVGGDEFVIGFPAASMAQAHQICDAIVESIISRPFSLDYQSFSLGISGGLLGTAQFEKSSLKEMVSAADTLCRMAKKNNTQRLLVMNSTDQFFTLHQDELELIACLERGQTPEGLFLVMQPEISLTRPFDSLNFEVLLRMRKPNGQVVSAQTIIEAAEAHGKSAIIDRWVITTTLTWLEQNAARLQRTRFVGVNLSGGSLNDVTFTTELFALFQQHRKALSLVCLEITETVALTDMRNMQSFISQARSLGAKVGLDDFGAGFSSFGYLKGLSADALKLDGSLVRGAATSPASVAIISSISNLVKDLGMKSIGEFAEDLPTIQVLVDAGIDYAQGYGISRPVMPDEILAARSSADFIQDPLIRAYFERIQEQDSQPLPLFS
jgi:diguanylate cyclase (GGDEF)-like protein/PAS domain S-box-containing protein